MSSSTVHVALRSLNQMLEDAIVQLCASGVPLQSLDMAREPISGAHWIRVDGVARYKVTWQFVGHELMIRGEWLGEAPVPLREPQP